MLREPPDLSADIPQGLMALVRRLLAKTPEDRYASAADVRAGLARLSSSAESIEAAPGRPAVWKRLAWGALAIGLAIVGYLFVMSDLLRTSSRAPGAATVVGSIAVLPLDNYSGDPEPGLLR